MKILITGISGFVGSHLAEYVLKNSEHEVVGTFFAKESLNNIETIKQDTELEELDIRNRNRFIKLLEKIQPEAIFHLAASSSVRQSFYKPEEFFSVNTLGTFNLLESIRKIGENFRPRVLLASSMHVYGSILKENLPAKEHYPIQPMNPYAASKAASELYGYQYYKSFGIPVIRVRPFNFVGLRQKQGFFIPDICMRLAKCERSSAKAVIKVGKLNIKRDFLDVRDAVRGIWAALMKGKPGNAYNVCSGKPYSLSKILDKLLSFSTKECSIEQDQQLFRPNDVPALFGSYEKLNKECKWRPVIDITKSLKECLDEQRQKQFEENK